MNEEIKQKLIAYAESKNGKAIQSITDKILVNELKIFFEPEFFFESKQLTVKKMAALILVDMKEPVCETCGKSVAHKFPWKAVQTTPERVTPYGAWARTCSPSCNQLLIVKEGTREATMLERHGVKNIMQKDGFAKEAMKNRHTDWVSAGIAQQKRRLLKRGVSKELIDSIDFASDESKANAIMKIAEEYKKEHGEYPNRYDLSRITGIHKTLLNRWLYKIPEYSHLYRSGNSVSKAQIEIKKFIESLGMSAKLSDRTKIAPFEIDVLVNEAKLGVEYCGVWCHSEGSNKDNTYHINKTEMMEEIGYNLLHVYDTEWDDYVGREIWKSIITHKLGKTKTKIYGRKCTIKNIDSSVSNEFMDNNHLQGHVKTTNHLGLFYEGELVMAVSYGKSRFGSETEIIRMATKINTVVVGGMSKLINQIKKNNDNIVCYADRRYSTSKDCGYSNVFSYVGVTDVNWYGFSKKDYVLYSRHKFMRHKFKEMIGDLFDDSKTTFENMIDNGYDRIWDCGNLKFIWNR